MNDYPKKAKVGFEKFLLEQTYKEITPGIQPNEKAEIPELAVRVWDAGYYTLLHEKDSPEKRERVEKLLDRSIELFAAVEEPELRDKSLAYRFELLYLDGFREKAAMVFEMIKTPHIAAWILIKVTVLHERRKDALYFNNNPYTCPPLPAKPVSSDELFLGGEYYVGYTREMFYSSWTFLDIAKSEHAINDFITFEKFSKNIRDIGPNEDYRHDLDSKFRANTGTMLGLLVMAREKISGEESPYDKVSVLTAIGLMMEVHFTKEQAINSYKSAIETMKTEKARAGITENRNDWVILGTIIANQVYELGEPEAGLESIKLVLFDNGNDSDDELAKKFCDNELVEWNYGHYLIWGTNVYARAVMLLGRCGDYERAGSIARKMLANYQADNQNPLRKEAILSIYPALRVVAEHSKQESEKTEREYADFIEAAYLDVEFFGQDRDILAEKKKNSNWSMKWVSYENIYRNSFPGQPSVQLDLNFTFGKYERLLEYLKNPHETDSRYFHYRHKPYMLRNYWIWNPYTNSSRSSRMGGGAYW